MAVNQQRKRAMKRLMFDQEELQNSAITCVSAAPLDENMFEWHCNFRHADCIYHLILFFPENYPYRSPSAEFVPKGFTFGHGATKDGKKGTQICLSIFSDFAEWHTEWAGEKSMGWSPGYTTQNVLLNLVSFLAENNSDDNPYTKQLNESNAKLASKFKCKDCGHTLKKPYPPLDEDSSVQTKSSTEDGKDVIIDYISKELFKKVKPKSQDNLFGYGLIKSGPDHRPALTSPCEFLTAESFFSMQKSIGQVQSTMKEDLACFLPQFIHPIHGSEIKDTFENTMKQLASILPKCKPNKTPIDEMVIKTIPNLMSATVVEFSKGTQHTSDNHLSGYFILHRLLLWAIDTYPELQGKIDAKLKEFIDDEENRPKKACPHIGEWLMLLSGSAKYRWQDAADAYLAESWRRNVMWYVKDDAKLGMLDTDKKYRLQNTLQRTEVSRKLLAFQVLFLDIAMPKEMSRKDIIKRYDDNTGFPTALMVSQMKAACEQIKNMKTYSDWFKVLKLKVPTDDEIFKRLVGAVEYSINTNGYHWSFWKGAGGWMEVLRRYKPKDGTSSKTKDATKGKEGKKAEEKSSTTGKGKGRGKKSKPKKKKVPTATLR